MMLQRMHAVLHLHLHGHLLLRQMFLLSSHEVLLFLLASLEGGLLLSGQGGAETWKVIRKRWLRRTAGWRHRRVCPGVAWSRVGRTVRNADLRDQEGLTGVSNASHELG